MAEPTGGQGAALGSAARDRLQEELAQARAQRRDMVAALGGEDPDDRGPGDRGDDALALEGQEDLARVEGRIRELERSLAGDAGPDAPPGLADGTRVTLRFPDGEATVRIVAIPQEAAAGEDVATADSPLGRALVGRRAGDEITYAGPDGDLRVQVLAIDPPPGRA